MDSTLFCLVPGDLILDILYYSDHSMIKILSLIFDRLHEQILNLLRRRAREII